MDVSDRTWRVRLKDGEELGPLVEEEFQRRLRAGEFPLGSLIRSDRMGEWKPLLDVVVGDETFRRESTAPPPEPPDEE
jgi:hypothetical protein